MRRHISAKFKKVELRLAVVKGYKYKNIRKIVGMSERTTQHLCALRWHPEDMARKGMVNDRPRILNGLRY